MNRRGFLLGSLGAMLAGVLPRPRQTVVSPVYIVAPEAMKLITSLDFSKRRTVGYKFMAKTDPGRITRIEVASSY